MKIVFIFATAIIGSYIVIRGISFVGGSFPSESVVLDLMNQGEYDILKGMLTPVIYAYLCSWLVLAVGGIIFQFWHNKDLKDHDMDYKKKEDNDE